MQVKDLSDSSIFEVIHPGSQLDRTISKPFCCDLLSIAMSKAPTDCAWVTVMGNINTLAVASLTDTACIILAEGAILDEAALKKAESEDISVFRTTLSIFDAALKVYQLQNNDLKL